MPDAIDTLRRTPLDMICWSSVNRHRRDLIPWPQQKGFARHGLDGSPSGVLPIEETSLFRWNSNPWEPDSGSNGDREYDPTFWLLPYYMGLYHQIWK